MFIVSGTVGAFITLFTGICIAILAVCLYCIVRKGKSNNQAVPPAAPPTSVTIAVEEESIDVVPNPCFDDDSAGPYIIPPCFINTFDNKEPFSRIGVI